jgi:Fe2+ transport system protein FeoA
MSRFESTRRLSSLPAGTTGRVIRVTNEDPSRSDRLSALGVTPGAIVTILQTFPGVVFRCDQTELAVEPAVATSILIDVGQARP